MAGPTIRLATLIPAGLALAGCTAMDVVSLPVKVAKTGVGAVSAGVDAVTTSQSEADQKRGRDIRQREERLGKLQRDYDKLAERCTDGDDKACRQSVEVRAEIDALLPGVPYEANEERR